MGSIQSTDTVLMVPPSDFGFNEQTALDNEFQTRSTLSSTEINRRANQEFQEMVRTLRRAGVRVLILDKPPAKEVHTPDAVFPNNWFSTEVNGAVLIYPMAVENRRSEIRPADLRFVLENNGFQVGEIIKVGKNDGLEGFLEGTGSLVIDHIGRKIYAAGSKRCHPSQFQNFLKSRSYDGVFFETRSTSNKPIYHTNVIMSIGTHFAVICDQCIPDSTQREEVLDSLHSREIIKISTQQMEQSYCGNILELKTLRGNPVILMSRRAREGYNESQLGQLKGHGEILEVDIPTIEQVGGGSSRCMVAEIFLRRGLSNEGNS
ncbi:hypothetical protein HOF92_03530 [bacterium]|jgi:hypothetical protein|nr:hypothetical protein [bacterium]